MPAIAPHTLLLNAAEGVIQLLLARHEPPFPPAPQAGAGQAQADAGQAKKDEQRSQPFGCSLVPLCFQGWHTQGQGVELLTATLQHTLATLHITPAHIARIACVQGPGSFTGIRLALGTAAGLARATGATQAGIEYTTLLAAAALRRLPVPPSALLVATHARRGLVHARLFHVAQPPATPYTSAAHLPASSSDFTPPLAPAGPVMALTVQEAATMACLHTDSIGVLGSGLTRNREYWQEHCIERKNISLLPSWFDLPQENDLLLAATQAEYGTADPQPMYVRPSDAEENLEYIATKLGIDPAEAQESLKSLTSLPPA